MKDNTVKMDADKVQKVKDLMLKNAELSAKTNSYWMGILDGLYLVRCRLPYQL